MTKRETLYKIEWRPHASEDLREIARYIGSHNPVRARSFRDELVNKVNLLAQNPRLGRAGRPELPVSVRELIAHRNYIIIYRVQNSSRAIEILRVKHAAQQAP